MHLQVFCLAIVEAVAYDGSCLPNAALRHAMPCHAAAPCLQTLACCYFLLRVIFREKKRVKESNEEKKQKGRKKNERKQKKNSLFLLASSHATSGRECSRRFSVSDCGTILRLRFFGFPSYVRHQYFRVFHVWPLSSVDQLYTDIVVFELIIPSSPHEIIETQYVSSRVKEEQSGCELPLLF